MDEKSVFREGYEFQRVWQPKRGQSLPQKLETINAQDRAEFIAGFEEAAFDEFIDGVKEALKSKPKAECINLMTRISGLLAEEG